LFRHLGIILVLVALGAVAVGVVLWGRNQHVGTAASSVAHPGREEPVYHDIAASLQ
jgi:hypothetical protein